MANRFYTDDILRPGEYSLTGPEAHHLTAVRRGAIGDAIVLFNGDGCEYPAEIVSLGKKSVGLIVGESCVVNRELGFPFEVACAMPKGDRGDFLIEKLTELGVSRFTPLITARTVVQPKDARIDNLRKAVIEASKQCGRNTLMEVRTATSWDAFHSDANLRVILHPGTVALSQLAVSRSASVAVVIGPEGGFTDGEIAGALARGWHATTLGPRILRIETAAIAAVSILGPTP
jgi:16S rRNA (uracil1498-N3)-methyltransferase